MKGKNHDQQNDQQIIWNLVNTGYSRKLILVSERFDSIHLTAIISSSCQAVQQYQTAVAI